MYQAIVKKGVVIAENVPRPLVSPGSVLIQVEYSCISAGTEVSSVVSSGKSLFQRAIDHPEKVKKALNGVRNQGIVNFINNVKVAANAGQATGYSLSGTVIAVGKNVARFEVGEKVAAAGVGFAVHAEIVDVPENLVVKIPQKMNMTNASTAALGGIALQGVRRAELALGEFGVVFGIGLVGLLTVQLLQTAGVRVIAIDIDGSRLAIAKEFGVERTINALKENPVEVVNNYTGGFGADKVLFTAATSDSDPLSQAFRMCKKKGRVVLVGVSGMSIHREDMYQKELDFAISTSYGPGRYDNNYELKGVDYPYSYVRWTENRNMGEYLRLVHNGIIKLDKIIDSVYPINKVEAAFTHLQEGSPKPLLVILDYQTGKQNGRLKATKIITNSNLKSTGKINVALIGTGAFAKGMHLPNLKKLSDKYSIHAVLSKKGYKAKEISRQYAANYATTDFNDIIEDEDIDLVLISTRHDSHFEFTMKALEAGKNVFVEKPLCVNREELDSLKRFFASSNGKPIPFLTVGYNRRFSPYAEEIKTHTSQRINPLFITYRMNAGFAAPDHWVHESGGRIVGEACHIIDLMTYFTESKIKSVSCEHLTPRNEKYLTDDNKSIVLKYEDGSVCNIQYFAVGSNQLSKEYMEVHFDGKSLVMDDYKSLKGYGLKLKEITSENSKKGHLEEMRVVADFLKNNTDKLPIEIWDLLQTTEVALLSNTHIQID